MSDTLVATLIAAAGLSQEALSAAREAIRQAGGGIESDTPVDPPFATDLRLSGLSSEVARAALEAALPATDVVVQPAALPRRKRLLLADMDSTMIGQECIDELADFAGLKAEIAAITARAMHGELDFSAALDARVAALKGLPASVIEQCLAERIHLTPGAETLVRTMKKLGARTVLVSGGFTAFTAPIARRIGFDRQVANTLHIDGAVLAGTVGRPIVDSARKLATLQQERHQLGLAAGETLAIGDGANDIPMIREAGLGLAFHAKPKAAAAANGAIRFGDLRTILWAQGIPQRDWA